MRTEYQVVLSTEILFKHVKPGEVFLISDGKDGLFMKVEVPAEFNTAVSLETGKVTHLDQDTVCILVVGKFIWNS